LVKIFAELQLVNNIIFFKRFLLIIKYNLAGQILNSSQILIIRTSEIIKYWILYHTRLFLILSTLYLIVKLKQKFW